MRAAANTHEVGVAEAFVELLYGAGKNPTRASLMKAFRTSPPRTIAGLAVTEVLDYGAHEVRDLRQQWQSVSTEPD